MAVVSSSSYNITNFHKAPLKPEPTFRVSISTRQGPSATWLRPNILSSNKPISPLKVCITSASPDDELPEKPADPHWRKIHGEDNWAGLLDPIDPALRAELLRYGEMAQACYEAFDSVDGGCKYTEDELLAGVDLEDCGYTVTRYLFRKASSKDCVGSKLVNCWAGYVAVSNDERSAHMGRRDIAVVWRGSDSALDWISQAPTLGLGTSRIPCLDSSVKIGSGFERLYTAKGRNCKDHHESPRDQVLDEISNLVKQHGDKKQLPLSITLTGHGLGSALATLCAFDVAETGCILTPLGRCVPVSVFSFSGPRVGNIRFKRRLQELSVNVLRVHNVHDVVPRIPGILINEQSWPWLASLAPWCWSHVGTELALDHNKSPFIKAPKKGLYNSSHNLELLLHLIDGYHGSNAHFRLVTPRDIALVNKDADLVRDDYRIPAFWRESMNTDLTKKKNGRWNFTHKDD